MLEESWAWGVEPKLEPRLSSMGGRHRRRHLRRPLQMSVLNPSPWQGTVKPEGRVSVASHGISVMGLELELDILDCIFSALSGRWGGRGAGWDEVTDIRAPLDTQRCSPPQPGEARLLLGPPHLAMRASSPLA